MSNQTAIRIQYLSLLEKAADLGLVLRGADNDHDRKGFKEIVERGAKALQTRGLGLLPFNVACVEVLQAMVDNETDFRYNDSIEAPGEYDGCEYDHYPAGII